MFKFHECLENLNSMKEIILNSKHQITLDADKALNLITE